MRTRHGLTDELAHPTTCRCANCDPDDARERALDLAEDTGCADLDEDDIDVAARVGWPERYVY